MRQLWHDLSASTATAGFVAVLVAFTSSTAVIYQAAQALGGTPGHVTSWIWAISLGCAVVALLPSLLLRKPVMPGWSVPGAVVIATTAASGGFTLAQGVGAFMMSAALIVLVGATGWFELMMGRIPLALANALLAGVLGRFALDGFGAARTAPLLLTLMLLAYLAARRWLPRYAVIVTLLVGMAQATLAGQMQWSAIGPLELARPIFVWPEFSFSAFMSMALPLFIVTMASQNLPGVAVMRATGYFMPVSRLITLTGLVTLVLSPFGCFSVNLSSITAAICMGPGAHEDPARRYSGAVVCGLLYLLVGCFAGIITGLLLAFPQELVLAIAGIALLGSIGSGLAQAMADERQREAALISFLVTLSGVSIAGIGSAFWGVVAGGAALLIQRWRAAPPSQP